MEQQFTQITFFKRQETRTKTMAQIERYKLIKHKRMEKNAMPTQVLRKPEWLL